MYLRLRSCNSFGAAISTVLKDVVALHGAEFGNIQLVVDDKLLIVAEWGLQSAFLLAFKEVSRSDGCACGRAWKLAEPTVIEDVDRDQDYEPFREIAREAG